MKAYVVTAPGEGGVRDVEPSRAVPGEVVVDVERVGVCGTDVEIFRGDMEYLHDGRSRYPVRLGHEWAGTVTDVGEGVDRRWLGRRVTGDTMLGCGTCARCHAGHWHVCDDRQEVGIRGGRHGALAEHVAVPASSLHALPDTVGAAAGALVEPGGCALRAARAAGAGPGRRVLVAGPGTIGLLTALFARAAGAEVHLLGAVPASLSFARALGFDGAWTAADLPGLPFDAVVDATNAPGLPAFAADRVEPGGRLVYVGLAGTPSPVDSRQLVMKDVTAVGVLAASHALAETIALYASGAVDPVPLVAGTVGLDEVTGLLRGERPPGAGAGPKVHVDPRG